MTSVFPIKAINFPGLGRVCCWQMDALLDEEAANDPMFGPEGEAA